MSEGGDLLQQLWELALSSRWFSGRSGRPVDVELGPWAGPTLRPWPAELRP